MSEQAQPDTAQACDPATEARLLHVQANEFAALSMTCLALGPSATIEIITERLNAIATAIQEGRVTDPDDELELGARSDMLMKTARFLAEQNSPHLASFALKARERDARTRAIEICPPTNHEKEDPDESNTNPVDVASESGRDGPAQGDDAESDGGVPARPRWLRWATRAGWLLCGATGG